MFSIQHSGCGCWLRGCASLFYGRGFNRRFPRFDFIGFLLSQRFFTGADDFNMGNDSTGSLADPRHRPHHRRRRAAHFVIWELGERHPALDLRLFGNRNYTSRNLLDGGFF